MEQININNLTATELKALAYDLIVQIEQTRNNLQAIQERIAFLNSQSTNPEQGSSSDLEEV